MLTLWANQIERADGLLTRALAEDPADRVTLEALAETRYRQLRFVEAAALLRQLGRIAMAAKVASLWAPYDVSIPPGGGPLDFRGMGLLVEDSTPAMAAPPD